MDEALNPRCCDQQDCGCREPESEMEMVQIELNEVESNFLISLAQTRFLPVCQFLMGMRTEDTKISALSPVLISKSDEDLNAVKEKSILIKHLEQAGLISIDFGTLISGFDYEDFKQSAAFKSFAEAVNEGKQKEGFLFDTAEIDAGTITLTREGDKRVQTIKAAMN